MKLKKRFNKLAKILEGGGTKDKKRAKALESMVSKLRKKEVSLVRRLDDASSQNKKAKLKHKLKACRAHVKKGEAALR